jgi:parallel beta-helix repeat protein
VIRNKNRVGIIICLLGSLVQAKTIRVPHDVATIQMAIDYSRHGDTVLAAPGIYYENINFSGKNLVVASHYILNGDINFIKTTIIDGSKTTRPDTGSCVLFLSGEDSTAMLTGFTITHGTGTLTYWPIHRTSLRDGGGVVIVRSSPTIKRNIIVDNGISTGMLNGGGIGAHDHSNPRIIDNIIRSNSGSFGAGISIFESSNAVIKNNIISSNRGGYIYGGAGIGINIDNVHHIIENNTIVYNTADGDGKNGNGTGGAMVVWTTDYSTSWTQILRNNIFWGNEQDFGGPISLIAGGQVIVHYCLVEGGYSGTGNIDNDPQFSGLNYLLSDYSPCIDAGDPNSTYNDLEDLLNPGRAKLPAKGGLRNDMGAYGGDTHE